MFPNGNKKYNSQMARRQQQQYQENDNFEEIASTPKQKIYQNAYNNMNSITSNSLKNQNNRININSNIKMNRNNNNMNNNNLNRAISNNINNNNLNRGISNNRPNNNSDVNNNNINKAIIILKNEFKKKDDKIKLLELKVEELERKINMIMNSKLNAPHQNNNNMNDNNNNIKVPFSKNFTFAEINSGEISPFQNNNENNKINAGIDGLKVENNNNVYSQNISSNQFQIKNNQYNLNKNNNLTQGIKENSILTGNSGSSRNHSKNEVKLYLKEVKEKVEPFIFKEFIKNIKLLTSSKEMKGAVDRQKVVENVKLLFGEQYKELFIKFEAIIGI